MDVISNIEEDKFAAMVMNAPVSILEMDDRGDIVFLNHQAHALLTTLTPSFDSKANIHRLLQQLAPDVIHDIHSYTAPQGLIMNDIRKFFFTRDNQPVTRHFKVTATKMPSETCILALEDVTIALEKELALRQATLDKAIAQGKSEIAADVLHDIGNAVVGLGSYITRIRRAVDGGETNNLNNLAGFFAARRQEMAQAIGEARASAAVSMLQNLVHAQKAGQEEIQKSINEQLGIITHIQELLNIQRQYVVGGDMLEKKPANLRGILEDCLSMLYASLEKRGITITVGVHAECAIIQGHRTKLMQVFMNILKNSMEAIKPEASDKFISIRLCQKGPLLTMEIADSGHGFDKDTGSKLFERGFTTKSSGTGLGLHNCQAILENHNATISLTSDGPGKGSLTTITFKM
jgi:signal transduction histidine kinase